ncbi:MAG: YybH family protein [Candidatus Dormibacterales bacterium]
MAEVVDRFVEAWNRHDMRALADLCASEGDFVDIQGNWFRNSADFEAALRARHASVFKVSRFTKKEVAVRPLSAAVAMAHAVIELEGATNPQGQALPAGLGVMTFVVERAGEGDWKILAFQNTAVGQAGPRSARPP